MDYDRGISVTLRWLFEREGYEVRTASDSDTALAAITDWTPDVAILDILLGNLNGIACGDKLRESYPDCKVIITCSTFADHWIGEAQARGFEIFGKPIPPEVLIAAANAHQGDDPNLANNSATTSTTVQ